MESKKFENNFRILNFTEEQRLELYGLLQQELRLFAIKKIVDDFGISQTESELQIAHINSEYGKCVKCTYSELNSENIECPKCGYFNYNLKEPIFNQEFCTHLEWKLSFQNVENEKVKWFWCDGVDHLTSDIKSLSIKSIEKNRQIETKAWIGEDGQDLYEMTIIFGTESINNYKNQKTLIDCIPDKDATNWIKIEPDKRRIEVELK